MNSQKAAINPSLGPGILWWFAYGLSVLLGGIYGGFTVGVPLGLMGGGAIIFWRALGCQYFRMMLGGVLTLVLGTLLLIGLN